MRCDVLMVIVHAEEGDYEQLWESDFLKNQLHGLMKKVDLFSRY